MIEFIKYCQSLSQSKRPKNNKSYDLLVQSHTDLLMFAKMHFFHIANILRAEVIKAAATAYKLIKLDVFDKNICLPVSSVKLTTATEAFLSSEDISASEKSNFRQDCIILLSNMISKLQERSPLKY